MISVATCCSSTTTAASSTSMSRVEPDHPRRRRSDADLDGHYAGEILGFRNQVELDRIGFGLYRFSESQLRRFVLLGRQRRQGHNQPEDEPELITLHHVIALARIDLEVPGDRARRLPDRFYPDLVVSEGPFISCTLLLAWREFG